jgi:large subunit ribosomal protein L9
MKVVLLKNIVGTGRAGETIEVSDGYARNRLIPSGLARPASPTVLREVKEAEVAAAARLKREVKELQETAHRVENLRPVLRRECSASGKLYAAVTPKCLADALAEEGITVSAGCVMLPKAIKTPGEYWAEIHFGHCVKAVLKFTVTASVGEKKS